jgi:hypothetical protein
MAAGVAAAAVAGVALASGGPPPEAPQPDPPAYTVVATGTAQRQLVAPKARSNRGIARALQVTRRHALPAALAAARLDAGAVGAAADLVPGRVVGIRRDVPPLSGYWDEEIGTLAPGKWCGRIFVGRRIVHRPDGTTRRVSRWRRGCRLPKRATARVTVTFAARPG